MSAQAMAGDPDGVAVDQSAAPVASALPAPSTDLFISLLRENATLHAKLLENANKANEELTKENAQLREQNAVKVAEESSKAAKEVARLQEMVSLHTKLAEHVTRANEQLSIENARLRQDLATRDPTSLIGNSTVIENHDQFTDFPKLPLEVRLMIWKLVAHQPRVVEIRTEDGQWNGASYKKWMDSFKCLVAFNNTPPAILHVNKESRNEALKHYKLGAIYVSQYPTYFNPESDIFYMMDYLDIPADLIDLSTFAGGWTDMPIRRMAIRLDTIKIMEQRHKDHSELFMLACNINYKKVKEIFLVDEAPAEDPMELDGYPELFPSLNQTRHLNLFTLSPKDILKAVVIYGWTDIDAESCDAQTVQAYIQEVYRYLEKETTVDDSLKDPNLKVTVARLKLKDSKAEAVEGGRRHIYLA